MTRPETSENERYLVPGLARGIAILRLFNSDRKVISAPEMAAELQIPRSTVFRLATTLSDLGLLQKIEHGQAFQLGIGLLGLGFEYLASLDISELGRPVIDRLAEGTGFSSHLVLRDGGDVVVVYKAQGRSALSGALTIGSRLPVHGTILGRASLMDCDLAELQTLFDRQQPTQYTRQTPKDAESLYQLILADREKGYLLNDSFYEQGISAIAAAVRDHTCKAFAAINITLPGSLGDYGEIGNLISEVSKEADYLSQLLAHGGRITERRLNVG